MKKSLIITTLVIGALIGASALSVLASGTWTGPTVLPPAGNVSAPLNIGALLQEKAGSLLLDGNLGVLGNLIIATGSPAAGKVLTALDANGIVTWTATSSLGIVGGSAGGSGGVLDYQLLTQLTTNAQGSQNGLSCPSGKKVISGTCLIPAGTVGGPYYLQNMGIDSTGTTFQCMFDKSDGSQPPIQIQTQVVCGTPASSPQAASLPTCSNGQTLQMVSGSWTCASSASSDPFTELKAKYNLQTWPTYLVCTSGGDPIVMMLEGPIFETYRGVTNSVSYMTPGSSPGSNGGASFVLYDRSGTYRAEGGWMVCPTQLKLDGRLTDMVNLP